MCKVSDIPAVINEVWMKQIETDIIEGIENGEFAEFKARSTVDIADEDEEMYWFNPFC